MRLNYYMFPDNISENILLQEGCAVILKSGYELYVENIPEDKRDLVDHIDNTLGGISITRVKQLIRKYGGYGWTEHIDRDGGVFETSAITLKGNNSKINYNHHL